MNTRYSIRREAEGLSLPFGAGGVAAIGALVGGLAGLLVPRAMLETAAFQLYLDTIIPAAKAPLGATAQLVAAVLLAIAGALAGYLVAWIFDVTASPGGFSGLLARLRGEQADDEEDAPPLRAADRHPDAPARRPFSAARDIPEGIGGTTIEGIAQQHFDDEDELLLDLPVAELAPDPQTAPTREPSLRSVADTGSAVSESVVEPLDAVALDEMALEEMPADEMPADQMPADEMIVARGSAYDAGDAMDGFDLAPPTLGDWETGAFAGEPEPESEPPVGAVEQAEPVTLAEPEPEPAVAYAPPPRVTPPPLDLSAARLDELIARLEAGLTRKVPVAVAPPAAAQPALAEALDDEGDTLVAERPAPPPTPEPEPDPAFPHDPALAAALATLRKMNLRGV